MRWATLALILISTAASADDDCRGNSCNGGGDTYVDTTVPVDSSSNVFTAVRHSSKSFGFGAGDVDINQCYRSYSVILWQDSRPNYWCMADSMDARGLHDAAARLRCKVKGYASLFDSTDECIAASTMRPEPVAAMPDSEDDDEDIHQELLAEVRKYEDGYAELQEKVTALESRKPPTSTRQVVQQPALTAEQRAKLRGVVQ